MELAFNAAINVRPTGRRLLVALGVSAVLVVVLLAIFAGFRFYLANTGNAKPTPITVYIERHAPPIEVESTLRNPVDTLTGQSGIPSNDPVPANASQTDQVTFTTGGTEQSAKPEPARDWHSMAQQVVRSQSGDKFRQDAARARMWRETPSVMFKPANNNAIAELEPVLPDLPFNPEIHVFGLGITIGSCFIGIPLVGIPVDERTAGPTLFYCARASR